MFGFELFRIKIYIFSVYEWMQNMKIYAGCENNGCFVKLQSRLSYVFKFLSEIDESGQLQPKPWKTEKVNGENELHELKLQGAYLQLRLNITYESIKQTDNNRRWLD